MLGKQALIEILDLHYAGAGLLNHSQSDNEIRFRTSTPLKDPQIGMFRSPAAIFNELAISHRLSLLAGRELYALPEESGFAIKSIETTVHGIDPVDAYDVSLGFEVMTRRRDVVTALQSTLVANHGGESRIVMTIFNILPQPLISFVRRARQFSDFADMGMDRDDSCLSAVADNHLRYFASEGDRLSDGRRVDHVPALTLIDIAVLASGRAKPLATTWNISAEFLNYTDPRRPFDILLKPDQDAVEFVQDGQPVAVVRLRQSPGVVGDGEGARFATAIAPAAEAPGSAISAIREGIGG